MAEPSWPGFLSSLLKDEQKVLTRAKAAKKEVVSCRNKTPLMQNNHTWGDRFLAKMQGNGWVFSRVVQWFWKSAGVIFWAFGCREVGSSSSCTVSGPSTTRHSVLRARIWTSRHEWPTAEWVLTWTQAEQWGMLGWAADPALAWVHVICLSHEEWLGEVMMDAAAATKSWPDAFIICR